MNPLLVTVAVVVFTVVLQLVKIGYFHRRSRAVQQALLEQVKRSLGESNTVTMAVPCQEGVWPPLGSLPILDALVRDRLLVMSNSRILVFDCSLLPPILRSGLVEAEPKQVCILRMGVVWGRVEVLDKRYWLHRRFRVETP